MAPQNGEIMETVGLLEIPYLWLWLLGIAAALAFLAAAVLYAAELRASAITVHIVGLIAAVLVMTTIVSSSWETAAFNDKAARILFSIITLVALAVGPLVIAAVVATDD